MSLFILVSSESGFVNSQRFLCFPTGFDLGGCQVGSLSSSDF